MMHDNPARAIIHYYAPEVDAEEGFMRPLSTQYVAPEPI